MSSNTLPIRFCTFLLLTSSLTGCFSDPVFTKRFKNISDTTPIKIPVSVSSFVVTSSPTGKRSRYIADLPGEAQAEAIKAMSKKQGTSAKQISELLSLPIKGGNSKSAKLDYTEFSRRIGVTTDYKSPTTADSWRVNPGDRIQKMATTIVLDGSGAKFERWSKLASPHVQIDLGDLTFKQTASSSIGTELSGVTIGSEFGQELTEAVRLRHQLVELYGALDGAAARLVQRSAHDRDLVGIQTIDFTIRLKPTPQPETVVTSFAKGSSKKAATLNIADIRVPQLCDEVKLGVTAVGNIRSILRGADTVTESDDLVTFNGLTGTAPEIVLVKKEELSVKYWTIEDRNGAKLEYITRARGPQEIRFMNYGQAWEFIYWAQSQKKSIQLDQGIKVGRPTVAGGFKVYRSSDYRRLFPKIGQLNGGHRTPSCR